MPFCLLAEKTYCERWHANVIVHAHDRAHVPLVTQAAGRVGQDDCFGTQAPHHPDREDGRLGRVAFIEMESSQGGHDGNLCRGG